MFITRAHSMASLIIFLICLISMACAAPTYHVESANQHAASIVNSFYTEMMEDVCDKLTPKACVDRDGYAFRYSIFDPVSRFCVCSSSPSTFIVNKKCANTTCPKERAVPYYLPTAEGCFCEIEHFFARPWNLILPSGAIDDVAATKSILEVERNEFLLRDGIAAAAEAYGESSHKMFNTLSYAALTVLNRKMVDTQTADPSVEDHDTRMYRRQDSATSTQSAIDPAVATFVPPPKKDITPELINQSLSVQPQNTAIVASVIAHLIEGIITFFVQLDGIVANLIAMNASTTFPCGAIGVDPQPDIMLVPKYVENGTSQTTIADCRCIAINQYKPEIINYWIQTAEGTVYSLVSSNKVSAIDKIDTGAKIALSMITTASSATKRGQLEAPNVVELGRRQVLKAEVCDRRCPEGMALIPGDLLKNPPECGCLAQEGREISNIITRGLTAPGPYTATMGEETCKSMKCTNNNDKPAMWNKFSMTCWCADPTYVEDNDSAWTPGV